MTMNHVSRNEFRASIILTGNKEVPNI